MRAKGTSLELASDKRTGRSTNDPHWTPVVTYYMTYSMTYLTSPPCFVVTRLDNKSDGTRQTSFACPARCVQWRAVTV